MRVAEHLAVATFFFADSYAVISGGKENTISSLGGYVSTMVTVAEVIVALAVVW